MKLLVILSFLGAFALCTGSRILLLIPMPAKSHFNLGDRLVEELVKKGHEVTTITSYKRSKPLQNVTEIILPDLTSTLFQQMDMSDEGKFQMRGMNPLAFLFFSSVGEAIVDGVMTHKPVLDLINSNQKFDLIIGECFLIEGLLAGFSYRYKAPIAGIATFIPNTWPNEMIANPAPAAYVPDPILAYTDKMNFYERTLNFLYTTLSQTWHYLRHLPTQDKVMRKHFGNQIPNIKDLLKKTSLVLVNHHYSLAFPRPYLPNMIEIGGYHVKPPKPLPQDLQKFLDEAKNGAIYFSMGSNLQSSEFPKEKRDAFLKVFSKLKQRVLWKFEDENLPNLPKNVRISKWLPQSDILAHPNVKLFITHGGLLSLTESALRGVPVLGIPVFGDQPLNMKYVVKLEMGVRLDYDSISETTVSEAIQEVLNNPKYDKNMKYRSKLLQDLPMSPIDTAIYWLEYVIRHKGAPHIQSAAQHLAWYELYLLDVMAVLGIILFIALYIPYKILRCICRTFCKAGKNKKVSSSKKKN